jgi:dephospho-CoA kinase
MNKKKDILIFINARKKEIDKRLKKRPNYNIEIIKQLKKLQLPLEIKKKYAHFIIKNNFNNKYVEKSVKELVKKILLND